MSNSDNPQRDVWRIASEEYPDANGWEWNDDTENFPGVKLLSGSCCGIRSERQLRYEVTMNLADTKAGIISDFAFDEGNDRYTCPNDKELRRFWRNFNKPRTGITKSNEIRYTSIKSTCN